MKSDTRAWTAAAFKRDRRQAKEGERDTVSKGSTSNCTVSRFDWLALFGARKEELVHNVKYTIIHRDA
jgi:hypothetical protein